MTNYLEEYFGMNEEQRKIEKELKTIQLAREFLLRALSTAYQQDPKSKTIKKGLRELAYVFLYGKWPVSLETTISIDGIDIQVMVLRIADTLEGVQESMRSDILAVHLQIKDPKGGPDWFIGNLVGGNRIIDPRFGIFACQIGQKGHSASADRKKYRSLHEVMTMTELPLAQIFEKMAEIEKKQIEAEFLEALRNNGN